MSALELRSIFGANLRELSATKKSIAHVCREIGFNRTQFNRYLNGESFPRPDVLDRICRYFGVDARIMTERLSDIEIKNSTPANGGVDLNGILTSQPAISDNAKLTPGLYTFWRNSFFVENHVVCEVAHLTPRKGGFRLNGRVFVSRPGQDGLLADEKPQNSGSNVVSQVNGIIIEEIGGYVYMLSTPQLAYPIIMGFVAQHPLRPSLFVGYSALAADRRPDRKRLANCVFERVPSGFASARLARKRVDLIASHEVPQHIHGALNPAEPNS